MAVNRRAIVMLVCACISAIIFTLAIGLDPGPESERLESLGLPPNLPLSPKIASWLGWGARWTRRPLPDTEGRIPNRLFVTWKTAKLPPRAAELMKVWEAREPQLERVVLTDVECAWLAEQYPNLKPRYDALSMNVMRADICRVLAVYFFGGLYKDLDVAWVQPLANWLDRKSQVVYGHEDDEHLCQWFFAARPGDPCIGHVLQHITNIIENVTVDFNKNVEAVIDITGPGAFTDGMRGCPTPPRFSVNDMKFHMIHHEYAAQRWQTNEYSSWLVDRRDKAGWNGIWPGDIKLNYYLLQPQHNFLAPLATHLPDVEVSVSSSSSFGGNAAFFGAHLAVDSNLDTGFMTSGEGPTQWFDVELTSALTIGTIKTENAKHLTGIRLYNRRRFNAGINLFNEGFFIELYDGSANLIFKSAKRFGTLAFHTIPFGGMPAKVQRIRILRTDKSLTFSEIQLFSDPALRVARRLKFAAHSATAAPLPPLLQAASAFRVSNPCPASVAISAESRHLFSLCRTPKAPCGAVVLSNNSSPATIDGEFVAVMQQYGCAVLAFTPVAPAVASVMHTPTTWCTPTETAVRCDTAESIVANLQTTSKQERLILVDATEADWQSPSSIVDWALQVKPQTLLLIVRFTNAIALSAAAAGHTAKLTAQYDLVAWHLQVSTGTESFQLNNATTSQPREIHTTWHLRG